MLCNENITWTQGIPCEWVQIVLPLGIILAIFLGAAIPYMVWHIAVAIYEFIKRKIEGRRESKTPWHPHIVWANDGDTARIVTELNARKQKHHLKFNGRSGLFSTATFTMKCSRCGKQIPDIQREFWGLAFDTDDTVFRPLVEKQLSQFVRKLGPCPGSIEEQYKEAIRSLRGFWGTEGFDV